MKHELRNTESGVTLRAHYTTPDGSEHGIIGVRPVSANQFIYLFVATEPNNDNGTGVHYRLTLDQVIDLAIREGKREA